MNLRIGTAGYSYPAWAGGFYPPGTPADARLGYYATQFPVVEINSTFYRPPTLPQVARMAGRVPSGFGFTLKVPRSASHDGNASELPAFCAAAAELARLGKLHGLVVQFAESFHDTVANRAWLLRIREALAGFPLAVEFRHRSWDTPTLPGWAEQHELTIVSVGVPEITSLFPTGLRVSGERVYARLHSANADAWYAGGPARYDYDYPESALRAWAAGLRAAAGRGVRDGLFFFNNCVGVQAVDNARRLMAILRETAPEVNVIAPPQERTLFDGLE